MVKFYEGSNDFTNFCLFNNELFHIKDDFLKNQRDSSNQLSYRKFMQFPSPSIQIRPFLNRSIWSKKLFRALKTKLVLLICRKLGVLFFNYLSLTNCTYMLFDWVKLLQPCFANLLFSSLLWSKKLLYVLETKLALLICQKLQVLFFNYLALSNRTYMLLVESKFLSPALLICCFPVLYVAEVVPCMETKLVLLISRKLRVLFLTFFL